MTLHHEPILLDRFPRFSLRSRPSASRRLPTPRAPHPGLVGGAWWPHSADLAAEITDLETFLAGRAVGVDRIMYDLGTWQQAPKRMVIGGHSVRLDGYRHLPAHTLCILGLDRTRLVLLVIPAATATAAARALLSAASRPGNELTADELVAADNRHSLDLDQNEDALSRWDDEGGHSGKADPQDRPFAFAGTGAAGGPT
ncbi:DUF5994 family protein [Nocardia rhamnosiphila]